MLVRAHWWVGGWERLRQTARAATWAATATETEAVAAVPAVVAWAAMKGAVGAEKASARLGVEAATARPEA